MANNNEKLCSPHFYTEIPMLHSPLHLLREPENPRSKKMWEMYEKMSFLPNPNWGEWEKRNPQLFEEMTPS